MTRDPAQGGLGFAFKWNMGWMNDTLAYFAHDPIHRRHHQDQLTFAMVYEYSERFVNPLSHDEVVHGKRSLLEKLPGDPWQKLAGLRALLAYQWTRPGKKLLFMGTELAPNDEWSHERSLDWHLAEDPARAGLAAFLAALGELYRDSPPLWRRDAEPEGFAWIGLDRDASVVSYARQDGADHRIVVLNLTPVPRDDYRVGALAPGSYARALSSDEAHFGGSGYPTPDRFDTEPVAWHGRAQSLVLRLPPLAAIVLAPSR